MEDSSFSFRSVRGKYVELTSGLAYSRLARIDGFFMPCLTERLLKIVCQTCTAR
jgi:hypothetical protein